MTVLPNLLKSHGAPKLGTLLTAMLLLSGCNVGPKYTRPQAPVPPAFLGADGASVSSEAQNSLGDRKWSEVFHQAELQALITQALANNYDLRIAGERILEAQAQVRIARANQFPQISLGGTGLGARLPNSLGADIGGSLVDGSLSASVSWSPDFWGLYRKQTEAARAQMMAQTWAQRAVRLTLIQQVATYYFQLRALDEQLAVSRRALQTRKEAVDLTTKLETGGATPLSDVRQAEQLLYTASSQIPLIEEQIQENENALRLLLGQSPGGNSGPVVHTDASALQPPPEVLPTGIPSQLLARRPDILQAEQQLVAANANVGAARAQFFPTLPLSASGGTGGSTLGALVDPASIIVYGYGTLTQPIFTGGKLRGQLELSQHQKEELIANYQKSISTAFRDVSNALISANKQRAQREEETKLVAAAQDATRLARLRYQGGATSFLEVLTTDANLYSAQLNLATLQGNEAITLVNLYAALGGGWQ